MVISHRKTGGFSLIELIVVVGIVAVLISMLLVVTKRVREAGRIVNCASNMRIAGLATSAYIVHYEGYFPTRFDPLHTRDDWIATYYAWGGKQGTEYPDVARLVNPFVGREGATSLDDGGVVEVFRCPSDNGTIVGLANYARSPTVYDRLGSSYLYNSSANNNDGVKGLFNKRLTQVANPVRCVLANELSFNAYTLGLNPFHYAYWHSAQNGWGNVLFVDGHVSYLKATLSQPDFQNGNEWTFVFNQK